MTENEAILTMVDSLHTLATAKEDNKIVLQATFDEYEKSGGKLTKKELVAVANAVANAEVEDKQTFHQAVADALANI